MPLDFSVALFYASLGLSAAAVVVFVWLMREPRNPEDDKGFPRPPTEGEG